MPLRRHVVPVEVCTITGKLFKRNSLGRREFVCPHGRRPSRCKEGDCIKNFTWKAPKSVTKCPCGSGITMAHCRKCNLPGAGTRYCEYSGKQKQTCVCGARTCGGFLCEHTREWGKCKECTPSNYNIHLTRRLTWGALKHDKDRSTIEYLGMDSSAYRKYMESTFQPGMTWKNQGSEWEIGHRIPLKYKKPKKKESEERLHYSNTFAQWKVDNVKQGNRYIFTKY